jgi:transcriptional regulator with XRE-family HTH domain
MGEEADAPRSVIAQRLDHLLATVHPAGRGPYLLREVVDGINTAAGEKLISVAYLSQLRLGQRAKPSFQVLRAIARFFGVPEAYFSDDFTAAQADEQLEVLRAIRDDRIRAIALRAAGLSERSLEAVQALVENARDIEGLPPAGNSSSDPADLSRNPFLCGICGRCVPWCCRGMLPL